MFNKEKEPLTNSNQQFHLIQQQAHLTQSTNITDLMSVIQDLMKKVKELKKNKENVNPNKSHNSSVFGPTDANVLIIELNAHIQHQTTKRNQLWTTKWEDVNVELVNV